MTIPETIPENIILCGFMGTGKTTVGMQVAARLHWRFVDSDHVIEAEQGRTINEMFANNGESAFRDFESELCSRLGLWRRNVIATGGGIILRAENRNRLLKAGLVVCLDAPLETLALRLSNVKDRPLLMSDNPVARIAELLAVRSSAYAALPNHIDTADRTPEQITGAILALWRQLSFQGKQS